MLLGREQNIIGHDPARVRACAEAHLRAYVPDDIDVLMQSVSPAGGIWAGLAPPDGAVLLRDVGEVEATYRGLLAAVAVPMPLIHTAIATDWYVFLEATGTVIDKASGQRIENEAICLFGNDDRGTAVDMAWPFGLDPDAGSPPAAERGTQVDLAAHERRIAGLIAGDVEAASSGIAEQAALFLPCFDPDDARLEVLADGRQGYREYLASLLALYAVGTVARCNLLVKQRYIFADYTIELVSRRPGQSLTVRYAMAEILTAAGAVGGMLGFATRL